MGRVQLSADDGEDEDEYLAAPKEEESLQSAAVSGRLRMSGLRWVSIGPAKPSMGRLLQNAQLAAALAHQTEFTQEEWDALRVSGLRHDHFVQVGTSYFQPLCEPAPKLIDGPVRKSYFATS